ncbi:hypothetical protein HS7_21160 [Sulfolobales archaeon HS-7]|nr:hypothetical protein HS7_21160 [Sulfolobales archaeon HS-7]
MLMTLIYGVIETAKRELICYASTPINSMGYPEQEVQFGVLLSSVKYFR